MVGAPGGRASRSPARTFDVMTTLGAATGSVATPQGRRPRHPKSARRRRGSRQKNGPFKEFEELREAHALTVVATIGDAVRAYSAARLPLIADDATRGEERHRRRG